MDQELQTKIRDAIKAPLRSSISTADFAVWGISSTKLSEIIYDIEKLIELEVLKGRIDELGSLRRVKDDDGGSYYNIIIERTVALAASIKELK